MSCWFELEVLFDAMQTRRSKQVYSIKLFLKTVQMFVVRLGYSAVNVEVYLLQALGGVNLD